MSDRLGTLGVLCMLVACTRPSMIEEGNGARAQCAPYRCGANATTDAGSTPIELGEAGSMRAAACETLSPRCPALQACGPDSDAPSRIRLVTWNVKVGSRTGLDAVVETLAEIDADVVLLQ